ncbi:hypothetical protein [Streptomyces cadmiisoli]|uniref:hypothetical protein n=1 Tax=Streptomyces cadmiisoli TaxID=2184053 RepID=UPI003654E2C6
MEEPSWGAGPAGRRAARPDGENDGGSDGGGDTDGEQDRGRALRARPRRGVAPVAAAQSGPRGHGLLSGVSCRAGRVTPPSGPRSGTAHGRVDPFRP